MATDTFVYCSIGLGGQAFDHHVGTGGAAFSNESCQIIKYKMSQEWLKHI